MIASTVQAAAPVDVIACASGLEALRVLPDQSFDLVLTDINMPDINGLELIQFLRSNEDYRRIPLVVISTESSPRDRQKGLALGADDYLVKPFDPEHLQAVIQKFLG